MATGARWVRADGKRPIQSSGRAASSTDPATWATLGEVRASTAGDGLGVMLGDGLGCYDLDDVTPDQVAGFLRVVPEPVVYAERSMSGRGAHLFVEAAEGPGWRRVVEGLRVERYTRARFIRVTFDRLPLT